jgi:hypothetical protein
MKNIETTTTFVGTTTNPFINLNDEITKIIEKESMYSDCGSYFGSDVLFDNPDGPTKIVHQFRLCNDSENAKRFNSFEVLGHTKSGRVRIKMMIEIPSLTPINEWVVINKTIEFGNALEMVREFCQSSGIYSIVK